MGDDLGFSIVEQPLGNLALGPVRRGFGLIGIRAIYLSRLLFVAPRSCGVVPFRAGRATSALGRDRTSFLGPGSRYQLPVVDRAVSISEVQHA